jgi:16S rRNA G966 N2-methylase RsmD
LIYYGETRHIVVLIVICTAVLICALDRYICILNYIYTCHDSNTGFVFRDPPYIQKNGKKEKKMTVLI